jgi:hypothetical protein
LVHKLVKLNPVKQTRNELKLGVVKFAQPITYNVLQLQEVGDFYLKCSNEEPMFVSPQNCHTKH